MRKNEKFIGSDFDDFLEEEGLLEDAEAVAAKRVFVFELEQELEKQKITKSQLAEMMGTSRSSINRLLNPNKPSTLRTLCEVARAIGRRIDLHIA